MLLATGLIYNLFTRYGFKGFWIMLKWIATIVLVVVSVVWRIAAFVLPIQLVLLAVIMVLSVYKWQRQKSNVRFLFKKIAEQDIETM